jgi:hypothetical protein
VIQWRKSSRSQGIENSDCVEVANLSGNNGLRDSKHTDTSGNARAVRTASRPVPANQRAARDTR